jgi:nucleoside-diphosphate-sugar epimerase
VKGVSRVFHCAGHVLDWGSARDFEDTNVRGTAWLLDAAATAGVERFVHFSSIAVFGTPSPPLRRRDGLRDATRPLYPFEIEGERIVGRFARNGMHAIVLRPAVVYGPRGTWLEEPLAMTEEKRLFLIDGGSGTCHPCYIENLLDATLLAAEHPRVRGRAYIVGDDDPISFRQYFDGVAAIAGRGPVRRSIPLAVARVTARAMEISALAFGRRSRPLLTRVALDMVTTKSSMSMRRIMDELGFRPRYDFVRAVSELRSRSEEEYGTAAQSSVVPPSTWTPHPR